MKNLFFVKMFHLSSYFDLEISAIFNFSKKNTFVFFFVLSEGL